MNLTLRKFCTFLSQKGFGFVIFSGVWFLKFFENRSRGKSLFLFLEQYIIFYIFYLCYFLLLICRINNKIFMNFSVSFLFIFIYFFSILEKMVKWKNENKIMKNTIKSMKNINNFIINNCFILQFQFIIISFFINQWCTHIIIQ